MSEARTYPQGVTSWIDTEQPDREAAEAFYGGLFGWQFTDAMPPGAPGYYAIASLDGKDVAGIGPASGERGSWNTYVAVDSADDTAAAVAAAGGVIVAEPADAGPGGRLAICRDPGGAEFRLWQARARPGAQISNIPGAWNFSDLRTSDPEAAWAFYTPLFGWEAAGFGGNGDGLVIRVPGYGAHLASTVDPNILERQSGAPEGFEDAIGAIERSAPGEPDHWHVTFTVEDRDAAAALAEKLGGRVWATQESQWTRSAIVSDPAGAPLTLSQFAPPEDW